MQLFDDFGLANCRSRNEDIRRSPVALGLFLDVLCKLAHIGIAVVRMFGGNLRNLHLSILGRYHDALGTRLRSLHIRLRKLLGGGGQAPDSAPGIYAVVDLNHRDAALTCRVRRTLNMLTRGRNNNPLNALRFEFFDGITSPFRGSLIVSDRQLNGGFAKIQTVRSHRSTLGREHPFGAFRILAVGHNNPDLGVAIIVVRQRNFLRNNGGYRLGIAGCAQGPNIRSQQMSCHHDNQQQDPQKGTPANDSQGYPSGGLFFLKLRLWGHATCPQCGRCKPPSLRLYHRQAGGRRAGT